MSKSLKLFLGISYIIILFAFLYLILSFVDLTRLDDFLYYKELQIDLEKLLEIIFIQIYFFFIFCLVWVSLLGFGSPLLIISGILFGKWLGTFISVLSFSIGALILYSIANFFFKDLVRDLLKKDLSNIFTFSEKMNLIIF